MRTKSVISRLASVLLMLLVQIAGYSQSPQGFSYQAVIRNGSGAPIVEQFIGVEITLQNGLGTALYTETHRPKTNSLGVISITIGEGTLVGAKTFASVPWNTGDVLVKVRIDPAGGTAYAQIGEPTELKSVPYALYTNPKEITSAPNADPNAPIFEVKNTLGQVVFGVYQSGVRVYVENASVKGAKGGFAVGGLSQSKAEPDEYLKIYPDSARVYVKPIAKGAKGGFAVGGLSQAKGSSNNFMQLTPENYLIGQDAGKSITTGLYNSFMGYQAGRANTAGQYNSFMGYNAGLSNTTGASNVFIGNESGSANLIGGNNVFLGFNAGLSSNASNNVFLGYQSGLNNTSGSDNVFIGTSSGYTNKTGASNVFIGNEAGRTNLAGVSNVFLGYRAGYANTASNNVFLGNEAGRNNAAGTNNAFIGYFAGRANISGANNVYLGNNAGLSSTSGTGNVAIGNNSASDVTSSLTSSVIIGENALTAMQTVIPVSSSLFIGKNAGINLGVGSTSVTNCVFIGTNAGDGVKNTEWSTIESIVALGNSSGKLSNGYRNVFIGNSAGYNYVGHQSTMIGFNVAQNASGTYNVFFGDQCALGAIGDNNTYIGRTSGTWVTGNNNVFLGYSAGAAPFSTPRTESNRLRIGSSNLIYGEFDNGRVVIKGTNTDNPSNYNFYVNGTAGGDFAWNNLSDIKLKKNINTISRALEKVIQLRGVNFEWKDPSSPEKGVRMGFIAQEAEKVIPEVVNKEGEFYSMQYAPVTAVLVEAIKEQQKQIEKQKSDFDALKTELEAIKALLKK